MNLRRFVASLNPSVHEWSFEARLLHSLTFFWLLLGLVALFSASYPVGLTEHGDGLYFFLRQLVWMGIGLLGFGLAVNLPLQRFLQFAWIGYLVLLVLVFATHIPGMGMEAYGANRWISVGPVTLQPSEFLKPFLILVAAQTFSRWSRLTLGQRLGWLALFAMTLLGILVQPNLSTTALCGITLWLMALAAGLSYRSLGITALSGIGLAALSISLAEYQRRRVLSFLDPWSDQQQLGDAFQLIQSLLAIGSGGVLGTGYGMSQQKLSYLPVQHTDFIFSVFAEEFGLLGTGFFILLLFIFSLLTLRVAAKTTHPMHRLIAIGALLFLVGQSLLNIGVATGVLPTTGLPLPFFSAGGSSIIASLLIAGLLIRVARESHEVNVVPFHAPLSQPNQPAPATLRHPRNRRSPAPVPSQLSSRRQQALARRQHRLQSSGGQPVTATTVAQTRLRSQQKTDPRVNSISPPSNLVKHRQKRASGPKSQSSRSRQRRLGRRKLR